MTKWLVFFIIFAVGCTQRLPLYVGDTRVFIVREEHGKGKSFIHLHQNETTALAAARAVIRKEGGSLMTLVHPGARTIVFHLKGVRYEFDPNRMFSDVGIKKTLMLYGPYSVAAHREVRRLSDKVKQVLPQGKIIAVHNNREYSLTDYFPGHALAAEACALHVEKNMTPRNFYALTQRQDYLRLNHANRMLQAKNATDDGSLSVYLARRHYINVEAGYDQFFAQVRMLRRA